MKSNVLYRVYINGKLMHEFATLVTVYKYMSLWFSCQKLVDFDSFKIERLKVVRP